MIYDNVIYQKKPIVTKFSHYKQVSYVRFMDNKTDNYGISAMVAKPTASGTQFKTPEEFKKQVLDNLSNLWQAAASGTDNSVSEMFDTMASAKAASLEKAAKRKKNGVELTADEKGVINRQANEWARTKGFEELKNELMPTDENGNALQTAGKFGKVWQAFNHGWIEGLMSLAENFRSFVSAVMESRNSDESFSVIRARKDFESTVITFGTNAKMGNLSQFLSELKNPPPEAITVAKADTVAKAGIPADAGAAARGAAAPGVTATGVGPANGQPGAQHNLPRPPASAAGASPT